MEPSRLNIIDRTILVLQLLQERKASECDAGDAGDAGPPSDVTHLRRLRRKNPGQNLLPGRPVPGNRRGLRAAAGTSRIPYGKKIRFIFDSR